MLTTGEGQLGIAWPLNAEFDVARYAVCTRANADGTWPTTPLRETSHNWWTDMALTNGTTYEYRVVAINHAGLAWQLRTIGPRPGLAGARRPTRRRFPLRRRQPLEYAS